MKNGMLPTFGRVVVPPAVNAEVETPIEGAAGVMVFVDKLRKNAGLVSSFSNSGLSNFALRGSAIVVGQSAVYNFIDSALFIFSCFSNGSASSASATVDRGELSTFMIVSFKVNLSSLTAVEL